MPDSATIIPHESAELRRALEAADPSTLLLALVQLTGERHWLEAAKPFIRGPMNYQEFMPAALRAAGPRPAQRGAGGDRAHWKHAAAAGRRRAACAR